MLTGLAVFVAPTWATQALIGLGALAAATGLLVFRPENPFSIAVNVFVAVSLLGAAGVALGALARGGLPRWAGAPREPARLRRRLIGPITLEWTVYLGTLLAIGLFALLVSGFSPLTADGKGMTVVPDWLIQNLESRNTPVAEVAIVVLREASRPAGLMLVLAGVVAFLYLGIETVRLERVARHRMYVVLILTFFSMLFWAFFEQAGSSVNNFTDRNVDRVFTGEAIRPEQLGTTIRIQPTQEQLGYHNGPTRFTLDQLDRLREQYRDRPDFEIDWHVAPDNVGMVVAPRVAEIPASTFQSVNPIFILLFGLVFTALWALLANRGWEPSTPVKFALGLAQLGLGFGAFWYGAQAADQRGMVWLGWLVIGYLFQTTGELCLSPVGLSMVTKLSPGRLVSTVMGAWFLATAFSQFLAAMIAQFTGVGGEGAEEKVIPAPVETVAVYGDVFGKIALSAIASGLLCLLLAPVLSYWMHRDEP